MEYKFNGFITSIDNYEIPFRVTDGIAIFSLQSKSILPYEDHGVLLRGVTDDNRSIYLLIDRFYELGFVEYEEDGKGIIRPPHIEGIAEVCFVLDSGTIDDVNSLSFYSLAIPQITGLTVSGSLNDENASWMGIKDAFGRYNLDNCEYELSIGFVKNEPYYSGQLLELKTENKFDLNKMKESYWLI